MKYRVQQLNIPPNVFNMLFSRRLPMLLTRTSDNIENERNLYSVADGKLCDLKLTMPNTYRCIGSSHGWLIFMDCVSYGITLYNPFIMGSRKGTIQLPPFLAAKDFVDSSFGRNVYPDYFICKAVLSVNPLSSPNFVVTMIYSELRRLACHKSGDQGWTYFGENQFGVFDVVFFDGQFLAVNYEGELLAWSENTAPYYIRPGSVGVGPLGLLFRRYILVSDDGRSIYQALRMIGSSWVTLLPDPVFRTFGFMIYELKRADDLARWIPVVTIGDAAFFVGDSYSCCVKATDFPNIRPNSIYFVDDYHDVGSMYNDGDEFSDLCDSGVYDIGEASFTYHLKPLPDQHKYFPPPIWILPTI